MLSPRDPRPSLKATNIPHGFLDSLILAQSPRSQTQALLSPLQSTLFPICSSQGPVLCEMVPVCATRPGFHGALPAQGLGNHRMPELGGLVMFIQARESQVPGPGHSTRRWWSPAPSPRSGALIPGPGRPSGPHHLFPGGGLRPEGARPPPPLSSPTLPAVDPTYSLHPSRQHSCPRAAHRPGPGGGKGKNFLREGTGETPAIWRS